MPTPPPVPAAQRYPVAIRDFVTYLNQPWNSTKSITTPNPNPPPSTLTTDLTLFLATVNRDLQTEILSLEKTIGIRPFTVPRQATIGKSIQWLYSNTSPGRVDARGAINPLPTPSHTHVHAQSADLKADDHLQYTRVDGTRGFTRPVTAPPGSHTNSLITLAQARAAGLTAAQVQSIINSSLATTSDYPITGPTAGRYLMAGGYYNGSSDIYGNIWIDFGACHFHRVLSFVYMKVPFPGGSMLGWPAFQYMEDQLILLTLDNRGATIQFIEDIVVDRSATVAMTWIALGD